MEKKTIETFIKKYNVGGLVEKVRWTNTNNVLKASAMTVDKKLLVSVELANFSALDGKVIGVGNTSLLMKTLVPLPDNFTLEVVTDEKDASRVTNLVLSDESISLIYNAHHLDQIDAEPKLKTIPPFETEVTMTEEFVGKMNQSIAALGYENFSFVMSKKKNRLELVLGYGNHNVTSISIEAPSVAGKNTVKSPISFSSKSLKSILSANSECPNPVLKISEQGLAAIEFEKDGFKSQYYLIKVDVED
jgi:hypothetical protein